MNEIIFSCNDLTKKYGKETALDNISFELGRGSIVGLLGPNGSGKTTLMKIANGLLQPTAGEIKIKGMPVGIGTKSIVSYLPDCMSLPEWMRIRELVKFYGDFYADFSARKAEEMLKSLGLDNETRFKTLSKGNKEKVQLILTMSRNAELYLLDEPMGGVDPATRDYILDTIIAGYSENSTVVISTHLIADVEKILDTVLFIDKGRIVRSDSVDSIRSNEGKSVDALFREVFRC